METPTDNVNNEASSFISKITEFDTDTKNNIMNSLQYCILIIIPLIILTKLSEHLFSNNDPDSKGSIELLAEIILQLSVIILAIICFNKVIHAIPAYSGTPLVQFNYTTFICGFILTSILNNHHNIADKCNTLIKRLDEAWSGTKTEPKNNNNTSKVLVSKPISGSMQSMPTHQVSRADYLNTHNQMSPQQNNTQSPPLVPEGTPKPPPVVHDEVSNNQNMYGGPTNTMIGTDFPPNQEPMAATEAFGGGGWSSW